MKNMFNHVNPWLVDRRMCPFGGTPFAGDSPRTSGAGVHEGCASAEMGDGRWGRPEKKELFPRAVPLTPITPKGWCVGAKFRATVWSTRCFPLLGAETSIVASTEEPLPRLPRHPSHKRRSLKRYQLGSVNKVTHAEAHFSFSGCLLSGSWLVRGFS